MKGPVKETSKFLKADEKEVGGKEGTSWKGPVKEVSTLLKAEDMEIEPFKIKPRSG